VWNPDASDKDLAAAADALSAASFALEKGRRRLATDVMGSLTESQRRTFHEMLASARPPMPSGPPPEEAPDNGRCRARGAPSCGRGVTKPQPSVPPRREEARAGGPSAALACSMPYPDPEDLETLLAARAGDPTAGSALVARHGASMMRTAWNVTGRYGSPDMEDIGQEALIAALTTSAPPT